MEPAKGKPKRTSSIIVRWDPDDLASLQGKEKEIGDEYEQRLKDAVKGLSCTQHNARAAITIHASPKRYCFSVDSCCCEAFRQELKRAGQGVP